MAISFVGSASAEANSLTLPTHQAGDLIVVAAFIFNSTAIINVPSDYWLIRQRSAGQFSLSGWAKIAKSNAEELGQFAPATHLVVAVYRSQNYLATGAADAVSAFSSSMSYATLFTGSKVEKHVIGIGATITNNTNADTPPLGMELVESVTGVSNGELAIHQSTTGDDWNVTRAVPITATQWGSIVFEIVDTGISKSGGGGGASFPPIGPGGLVY